MSTRHSIASQWIGFRSVNWGLRYLGESQRTMEKSGRNADEWNNCVLFDDLESLRRFDYITKSRCEIPESSSCLPLCCCGPRRRLSTSWAICERSSFYSNGSDSQLHEKWEYSSARVLWVHGFPTNNLMEFHVSLLHIRQQHSISEFRN